MAATVLSPPKSKSSNDVQRMPVEYSPRGRASQLPQETTDMIIDCLAYNFPCLFACSLTCRSWYTAALPHLHTTLFSRLGRWEGKYKWPNPLESARELRLLPLVRNVQIYAPSDTFSPENLDPDALRHFSALTNVRRLSLWSLDIPSFMHTIRHYFGHLFPTVTTLTLASPKGSNHQILFFIGSFRHLEDLALIDYRADGGVVDVPIPAPPYPPPLGGRLIVNRWRPPNFFEDMIQFFGSIRFRYLKLNDVQDAQFLLEACADTLQTLRLVIYSSIRTPDYDLSRNKSLHSLEVSAESLGSGSLAVPLHPGLKYALETIQPPGLLRVIVHYYAYNIPPIREREPDICSRRMRLPPQAKIQEDALTHHNRSRTLREALKIRDFSLTLRACVPDPKRDPAIRYLKEAVAAEKEREGPNAFPHEPLVDCRHRPVNGSVDPWWD